MKFSRGLSLTGNACVLSAMEISGIGLLALRNKLHPQAVKPFLAANSEAIRALPQ
jgi:hypothetical protein